MFFPDEPFARPHSTLDHVMVTAGGPYYARLTE